ncbi:hypothetical protein F4821DRAFT_262051 [Hypoxylon rubiginosum]|uniref:Uncharacterized protein n=1 Tax=Hypoxylon rubiginosum TaxID=110542 RepID=A0ACC0CVH6_9PEZI|nr:hypothetical protein F4821DRAFT_262051 [Hypoxylon rubiginosum]
MEPGTILSIVQLSGSILNLGSKVAKEFLGNDKVRDKLVNLNVRLQTFYKLVDDFVQDAPGAPSQLEYPGAGSIIKTLNECKGFLEQYDRTLSANRSLGGATQRAWLVLGPDGPKVEDFNNRINQHIQELHFWTSQIFQREFRSTITTSPLVIGRTPNPPPQAPSPELPARTLTPSRQDKTPELPARSRNHSYDSILERVELPPSAGITPSSPNVGVRRPLRPEHGPVLTLLGASGQISSASLPYTPEEPDTNTSSDSRPCLSIRSIQSRGPGHPVSLHIGSRTYKSNTNYYEVLDLDGVRVVDWIIDTNSEFLRIRHFVSPDRCRILHTVPNDVNSRASFLPRDLKHRFEITSLETGSSKDSFMAMIVYQFNQKPDREIFQQKLRGCEYLKMVQATKVCNTLEKEIARIVHLKVWRRNDRDDEPTFSFTAHQSNQESHHVEYKIRWFKKAPELRGENKLVLRLYSADVDLDYGPPPDEPRRKSSTLRTIGRRLSGDFSAASASHSRSRSSSAGASAFKLYDYKGIEPPAEVRGQGDLEIGFANPEFRKTFINACFEAHRPSWEAARRNSTPSPILQQTLSRPPSLTLGPNRGPYELGGAPVFEMPSPSLTFEPVRYNVNSQSTPPRLEQERAPEAADNSNLDGSPRNRRRA